MFGMPATNVIRQMRERDASALNLVESTGNILLSDVPSSYSNVTGLDLKSIEERITKLETSVEGRLLKVSSDSMSGSVILCKSVEDRLTQKIEALRKEMKEEMTQADFGLPQDVALLRNGLLNDMQQSISREFANIRLELQGSIVAQEESCADETRSIASSKPSTFVAGFVDMISGNVLGKVREDEIFRRASDQYEQLKDVIQDLRTLPSKAGIAALSDGQSSHTGTDSLHTLINNVLQISQSLANELDAERHQRSSNFAETLRRLEVIERKMSTDPEAAENSPLSSGPVTSSIRKQLPLVAPIHQDEADNFLVRVMRSLEPHIIDDSQRCLAPHGPTPQPVSVHGSSKCSSRGTEETGFSTEVRSLRSRLENILLIGDTGASGMEHSKASDDS